MVTFMQGRDFEQCIGEIDQLNGIQAQPRVLRLRSLIERKTLIVKLKHRNVKVNE